MGDVRLESSIKYFFFPVPGLTTESNGAVGDKTSLPFFEWKAQSNISDRSYDKLRTLMLQQYNLEIDDIRTTRRQLASELGIYMREFHCCINGCMAFTGTHESTRICSHCKTPRFYGDSGNGEERDLNDRIPRALFRYLPIIPRLKLLYANKDYSRRMRYPKNLRSSSWEEGDGVRDVWEGEALRELINRGMTGFPMRLHADTKDFSRTSVLWLFIFRQTVFSSFVMAVKMYGPFSLST